MRPKLLRISQLYVTALRKYLKPGCRTGLLPAQRLGRQALTLGVETLELARIHEKSLITLDLGKNGDAPVKRAEIFFTEALTPIMETHRAARPNKLELNRLNLTLDRRTAELAAASHELRLGVVRRKNAEAALKLSGARYAQLLKESLQLQQGLRQLTHRVLRAQEDERQQISRELRDEIAQTLLGINVRLITLKREAGNTTQGLANEIATTRRLVLQLTRSVWRGARKLRDA